MKIPKALYVIKYRDRYSDVDLPTKAQREKENVEVVKTLSEALSFAEAIHKGYDGGSGYETGYGALIFKLRPSFPPEEVNNMGDIICDKCKVPLKCTKTGKTIVFSVDHAYQADEYTCPKCKNKINILAKRPFEFSGETDDDTVFMPEALLDTPKR